MQGDMPRVFIASSKESLRIAEAVKQNLDEHARVRIWSQDALQIGQNVIDELSRNLRESDFGIFVFAPDDRIMVRGQRQKAVRDNVILELGMFIGRLGKERSFVIRPRGTEMRLPSDLLGVVPGEYDFRADEPRAALGSVSVQIREAMQRELRAERTDQMSQAVRDALETVCRAVSVPVTPEKASLRAFIFRYERSGDKGELVCRQFFDPNPSDEEVGRTRFRVDEKTAAHVVVVRCFLDARTRRTGEAPTLAEAAALTLAGQTHGEVHPLPKGFRGAKGKIDPELRYVLAAPIWRDDGSIWGVVDFDASNDKGRRLLRTQVSSSVIMLLARHLNRVLP